MKMRNIPSEYAVTFLIAIAVIFIIMTIVGTSNLSSELDEIGASVQEKKIEVER